MPNQNPDAVNNGGFVLFEDTSLTLTPDLLLGNDSDPDGNLIAIQSVQDAVGGSVGFDQEGNVVFTPTANYTGTASFTYTISDGNGGTDTATATLTVKSDEVSLASVAVRAATNTGLVSRIDAADFTGDGLADIALVSASTHGIITSSEGNLATALDGGSFAAAAANGPATYKFAGYAVSAGYGDINNDGVMDALNLEGSLSRSLTIRNGSATPDNVTDQTLNTGIGYSASGVVVADFNGDGRADIFTSAANSTAVNGSAAATTPAMSMWLGSAGGFTTNPTATAYSGIAGMGQASLFNAAWILGAADINGDGYDDIATGVGTSNDGQVNYGVAKVTFGNAAGSFAADMASATGGLILNNMTFAGGNPLARQVAGGGDVTGDGIDDMAGWIDASTGGFVLFGNSAYTAGSSIDVAALNGQTGVKFTGVSAGMDTMALGDLNGDGLSDIVVGSSGANSGAGKLWVVWGKEGGFASGNIDLSAEATGQFITITGAASQGIGTAVAIADIDGDGFNDLVVGSASGTIDVIGHHALPVNNAAPVAQGEAVNGTEDQALTIAASTLLSNDSDVNGDALTIASVDNASHGAVTLNADGSVSFTPTANHNGVATFDYTVSDGRGGTATATATINFAAVNDAASVSVDRFTFVGVEQVSSQYQTDISNFINVLTDTHETAALPEQYRNGTGPITLDALEREVIVHFHSEVAGNQSVIGFYVINADGSFGPAQLVFPNASQTPPVLDPDDPNNSSDTYSSVSLGTLPAGASFGLFMISNGAGNSATNTLIQQVANGTASFSFVNGGNSSEVASLFDTVPPQLMVHGLSSVPSTGTAINQANTPIFHTAASATAHFNGQTIDTLALNTDGAQHVAAGQGEENDGANMPAPDRIAIGWEDLPANQNADFDFNDVILQVEVAEATLTQVNPANVGAAANLALSDIDHPDAADADLAGAVFRIAEGFVAGDALQLSGGFSIDANGSVLDQGVDTGIDVVGGGFGGDPANPNGLTLTGLADLTLYEQILRSVTFTSSSAAAGVRTLNITVTDDAYATSTVAVEHLAVGSSSSQNPIFGTTSGDTLNGTSGSDFIFGDAGNDILSGAAGNDVLVGGDNNDVLVGGSGADTLNGGAGIDNGFYLWSTAAVNIDLTAGTASGGDAQGDVLIGIEDLTGSAYNDTLVGDGGANWLAGQAGNDTLTGYAGNDTLDGGDGNDILVGGSGADTLNGGSGIDNGFYLWSTAAVNIDLTSGTASGGDAQGDALSGIEDLTGSAYNDTLVGDGGANWLAGQAGNDTLTGFAGDDTLDGGDGNDILVGGSGADTLNGGSGIDNGFYLWSTAAVNIDLTAGTANGGDAQGDALSGIEDLTGSAYDDTLTGDNGANWLAGQAGNDILSGGGSDDLLEGGDGNDTFLVARGDGIDSIVQSGITDAASTTDILQFSAGVAFDQLWFRQSGNDLRIDVIGEAASSVYLRDWYTDSSRRVDSIQTVDGSHGLASANVQALVDAMAGFSPPSAGQMTLAAAGLDDDLNAVLAANWA